MEIISLSSEALRDVLGNIGLQTISYSEMDRVGKEDLVIINDTDSECTLDIITELLDNNIQIVYLMREPNRVILSTLISRNSYNIVEIPTGYKITTDDVVGYIELKQTKREVEHLIDKDIEVNNISDAVYTIEEFMRAIASKDKEQLKYIYDNLFEDMLAFPEMFKEAINETHTLERKIKELSRQVTEGSKSNKNLNTRLDTLITAGRKTEEANNKLMKAVESLKVLVEEKEEEIKASDEKIFEQSRNMQKLERDKTNLAIQVENSATSLNFVKSKYDKAMKEIDALTNTVKSIDMKVENVEVNLTSTGKVEKILYIKAVDMVPYIVSSFALYPKYAEKKLKLNGCSIVLITPKDSVLYREHSNKFLTFDEKLKSYERGTYVLNGYDEKIEHLIKNIDSQVMIIIDLTFRDGTLTKSVRQHNMYIINSAESIDFYRLNPENCISFNSLQDYGVTAHIPNNAHDKSDGARIREVRESLYVVLDRVWR